MHRVPLLILCLAVVLTSGCISPTPFTCKGNEGCVRESGAQGICEAQGVCSFPDSACPGSRRRLAAQGNKGACVPVASCISHVSVGAGHVCVLRTDNAVYCWGDNTAGKLGDGTTINRESPVRIDALPHSPQLFVTQVAAGEVQTCALLNTGAVYCWGANGARELGNGTAVDRSLTPVQTLALAADGGTEPFVATVISVGGKHTCAIGPDKRAYCWGENQSGNHGGQCGVDPMLADDVPVATEVAGLEGVVEIGAGDEFTCARKDDKSLWCWGANGQGELGNGTIADSFRPVNVGGISSVSSLAVGDESSCARRADSSVWCWGYGGSGALGNGSLDNGLVPVRVGTADQIGMGGTGFTVCLIDVEGVLTCFGDNSKGQAGTGSTEPNITTPTPAQLVTVKSVSTGSANGCAVTLDGALWCWGENDSGQLGQGPGGVVISRVPVRVNLPCP